MENGVRTIFMGSPDFAVPVLKELASHYPIAGVVTQPDRPSGRSGALKAPAVKKAALSLGLPLIQPEKLRLPEAMEQLRAWAPELVVVAAFGQILRPEVLDLPKYGCINVHGSLLPRWRGAAPVQAAILAGDRQTGITILKMDAGVDTGPILSQRAIEIEPHETAGSLFEKLAPVGASLLIETLPGYLSGESRPQPQPETGVTFAPMLKKENGRLDFKLSALVLERQVRAFFPWPGTWMDWSGSVLKVLKAHELVEDSPGVGKCIILDGLPAIGTGKGILALEEVQPAGRRAMSGKAFLIGSHKWE